MPANERGHDETTDVLSTHGLRVSPRSLASRPAMGQKKADHRKSVSRATVTRELPTRRNRRSWLRFDRIEDTAHGFSFDVPATRRIQDVFDRTLAP